MNCSLHWILLLLLLLLLMLYPYILFCPIESHLINVCESYGSSFVWKLLVLMRLVFYFCILFMLLWSWCTFELHLLSLVLVLTLLLCFVFLLFYFLILGLYTTVHRPDIDYLSRYHFWQGLGNQKDCLGLNPSWLHSRQIYCLLYYLSGTMLMLLCLGLFWQGLFKTVECGWMCSLPLGNS